MDEFAKNTCAIVATVVVGTLSVVTCIWALSLMTADKYISAGLTKCIPVNQEYATWIDPVQCATYQSAYVR